MLEHPDVVLRSPEVRQAWIDYLAHRNLSHFVTLTTNEPRSSRYMIAKQEAWYKRINRSMLGTRWLKKPDEFMISWSFPELLDVNSHWHGLTELLEFQHPKFNRSCKDIWEKLVPSGTVDIQLIGDTEHDRKTVSEYVTKHISSMKNYECIRVGKFIPTA